MVYRITVCLTIILPVLCIAAESNSTATNLQTQPANVSGNPSASAPSSDQEYEKLVKELTKYKIPVTELTVQSGIQRQDKSIGKLFEPTPDAQTNPKATQEDSLSIFESQKLRLKYILIIAIVIGAWFWNKHIRLRCPECGRARPVLVGIEDTDSWTTSRILYDRRSEVRPNTQLTNTAKVRRIYMCMPCGKRWNVVTDKKSLSRRSESDMRQ